jgi:hypothetical protein
MRDQRFESSMYNSCFLANAAEPSRFIEQPIIQIERELHNASSCMTNADAVNCSRGRLLMNVSVDYAVPAPPITIVQNWQAAIKK